jgi:hypothetical protein
MSTNAQNNQEDQEIDLSVISKKISGFFEGISMSIFKGILFVKKNMIIFISLFVFGVVAGYFLDTTTNTYDHEVIVSPNFGSTDYLYAKIDLLESRVSQGDSVFLKSIGIENPSNISLIEIDPIIDIYSFVNNNTAIASNAQNTQNFELVKLLSEDGDIKKVIKDKLTSKNYAHHIIHISTKGFATNKNTIDPILNYLNKNEYFEDVQKTFYNNIKVKMKQNEGIIEQINGLLNQFSLSTTNNQKSDKLVYYNENTQLNEIIGTKNALIGEMGTQRLELINVSEIIKKNSSVINVKNTKGINNKMKLILPLLLIFGFIGFSTFKAFYKKQSAKFLNK